MTSSAILANGVVRVRGVVTVGTGLLPSGAHLVVIQDRTAAIEIRLQAATGSIPCPAARSRLSAASAVRTERQGSWPPRHAISVRGRSRRRSR